MANFSIIYNVNKNDIISEIDNAVEDDYISHGNPRRKNLTINVIDLTDAIAQ